MRSTSQPTGCAVVSCLLGKLWVEPRLKKRKTRGRRGPMILFIFVNAVLLVAANHLAMILCRAVRNHFVIIIESSIFDSSSPRIMLEPQ